MLRTFPFFQVSAASIILKLELLFNLVHVTSERVHILYCMLETYSLRYTGIYFIILLKLGQVKIFQFPVEAMPALLSISNWRAIFISIMVYSHWLVSYISFPILHLHIHRQHRPHKLFRPIILSWNTFLFLPRPSTYCNNRHVRPILLRLLLSHRQV